MSAIRVAGVKLVPLIALFAFVSSALATEPIPLRAGPLTMALDTDNVFLRYVRIGPHEVLRGINAPVRDQNWATVAPHVSNLRVENRGDSFDVTFDVRCQGANIDFLWKGSISGSAEGVVEFTFDGLANSTFQRNRIGFCVLHGPSAAGQPWLIETADGETSEGQFPKFISPHQPAKNLKAITHDVAPGIRARVDFVGEVFEMEDQRNWTDASFKTYCTPLEIPYPVEIAKGTKISQKIRISEFAGGQVRQIDCSDTLAAVGLALHQPGRMRVLVGNLTGEPQTITLRGLNGKLLVIQLLGADKIDATPELRINLPPYGIAQIDRAVD